MPKINLISLYPISLGYLVHKSKDSRLGKRKYDIPLEYEDDFVASEWIDRRNRGGLQYAYKSFYRDVRLWEHMFREFHKDSYDGLSREKNVVKNLTNQLIEKFGGVGHYDHQTLWNFAFVRSMTRLKALQRHLAGTGESYRSKTKRIEFAS